MHSNRVDSASSAHAARLTCCKRITAALLLGGVAASANAAIVFDGGPADIVNGQALFWEMADDFEVPAAAVTNGASVPVLAILGGLDLATWDGTIKWTVYAAGPALLNPNGSMLAETTPGAVIAQGLGQNILTTFKSQSPGPSGNLYQYYDFDFEFGQDIQLEANTRYWFGIHLNEHYTQAFLYCQETSARLFDHNFGRPNPSANFSYQGAWMSFKLTHTIPAPGAAGLALSAALLMLRRRRAGMSADAPHGRFARGSSALVLGGVLIGAAAAGASATTTAQVGFEASEGYAVGSQLGTHSPWVGPTTAGWTVSNDAIGGSGARSGDQWILIDANDGRTQTYTSPITDFTTEPIVTVSSSLKVVSPVSGVADRGVFMGMLIVDSSGKGYAEIDLIYDIHNVYGFGTDRWLVQQIFSDFSLNITDLGTTPLFDTYLDLAIRTDFTTNTTTMLLNGVVLPGSAPSMMVDYQEAIFVFASTITGGGGTRARGGLDNFSVTQTAVPSPGGAAVLGLLGVAGMRRRR